jgi:PAS domain S-box-containing protein
MNAHTQGALNPRQLSYETVINSTRDMIWAVDRNYCLLFFNTALQNLYTQLLPNIPTLAPGLNIVEISPPEWATYFARRYERAFTGEQFQVVLDNEVIALEMTFSPIFGDDQTILGASVFARDITERKQREEWLARLNQRLLFHIQETPLGYIEWDMDIQVRVWNPAAERIFGYTSSEVLGRRILELIVPERLQEYIIDMRARLKEGIEHVHSTNANLTKDGREIICEWFNTPLKDHTGHVTGWAALVQDVTERSKTEAELRRLNDELQSRVNEISTLNRIVQTAVASSDPRAALTSLAEQITRLFNVRGTSIVLLSDSRDALTIVADFDVFPDAYNSVGVSLPLTAMPLAAELLSRPRLFSLPYEHIEQSLGSLVTRLLPRPAAWLNILPLMIRGILIGAAVMVADHSLEESTPAGKHLLGTVAVQVAGVVEHMRLFEANQRAREQAEAASLAKSRFLATMSHELRTPLNSVLGYVQLLQEAPKLSKDQRFGLAMIEQSSNHLLQLINDVLDLASIEAGKVALNQDFVALGPFFTHIAEMIKPRAHAKQLDFRLDLFGQNSLSTNLYAYCDERRLRQIILNLLGNAIKFTTEGYVTLRVALHDPLPAMGEGVLRVTVEDTGPGIDPQDLAHVFEPFYQTEAGRRQAGSTGLGLAVCNELLDLMGSRLQVNSMIGVGSLFWFELPVSLQQRGAATRLQTLKDSPQLSSTPALPPLPESEAQALTALVAIGDLQAIQVQVEQLVARQPELTATTALILEYVRNFELQKLRDFLKGQDVQSQHMV